MPISSSPTALDFRLSIIKGGSLNAIVEFDLRLGSGRTDAEPCAVVHIIVKNIGLRKTGLPFTSPVATSVIVFFL